MLSMHLAVINRVDDDRPHIQQSADEFHEIPFATAFFDPQQVCIRSPLNPLPLRRAMADDLIHDYLRCFVLYSDWVMSWEEFQKFNYQDQLILGQNGYSLFHYWMISLWTADAQINGICYSNGTFFERGGFIAQIGQPQLELLFFLVDKMLDTVIKDIRALKLTSTEKICLFAIAFFFEGE